MTSKDHLLGSTDHTPPVDPLKEDFRNFLYLLWKHLGLPDPTPAQYEIAYFMQHGFPETYDPLQGRSDMVMAFRGLGKSYIAAAYALWRIYCDPLNEKILVVSASSTKAKEFVSQCKGIIDTWDLLEHLRPRADQRNQADRFDVNGASISQSHTLKAAGITGQITGSRATLIISDDIEVTENSRTEDARERLINAAGEFDSIVVPAVVVDDDGNVLSEDDPAFAEGTLLSPKGDIVALGTPQSYESIYNRFAKEQNFNIFCIPARFPTEDKRANYVITRDDETKVDILAPFLKEAYDENPKGLAWKPTDTRFGDSDLLNRESKGRSRFFLQFMLDTTLSDAERYPLKQNDLIVFPINSNKAPETIQWGRHSDRLNVRDDIPNVGFTGDYFMGPLFVDNDYRPYTGSVMFVDPSGRGADETAWAIVKVLHGMFFVPKVGGFNGSVEEAYLKVAQDAKAHNVNLILIEPNFAPGVWIAGFNPVLLRVWPATKTLSTGQVVSDPNEAGGCKVEEAEWAQGRKEERIIDTLEPVMNTHRMVVDESVARDEVLMHQLTHLTREANCLKHDDRADCLAGAIAHFERVLMMDVDQSRHAAQQEDLDKELEDFIDLVTSGTPMTMRNRGEDPGKTSVLP